MKIKPNFIYLYIDIDGKPQIGFYCRSHADQELCRNSCMGEIIEIPIDIYDCGTHKCHDCEGGE
jgi:hypothetical protein